MDRAEDYEWLYAWEIEVDWKETDYSRFNLRKVKSNGTVKKVKFYSYDNGRLLSCGFKRCDKKERTAVEKIMKRYYNHVSSDYVYSKGDHAKK